MTQLNPKKNMKIAKLSKIMEKMTNKQNKNNYISRYKVYS